MTEPNPSGVRRRPSGPLLVAGGLAAVLAIAVGAVGLAALRGSDRPPTAGPAGPTASTSPEPSTPSSTAPSNGPGPSPSATAVRPVPAGFLASDLSFVSADRGWALGTAACATPPCTSLLRTVDGGRHWSGGPAPVAPLLGGKDCADERQCVRSVRFADARRGYVFGGGLLTTADGGQTWSREPGPFVDALEVSGGDALRVVHSGDGCPPGCTYTVQRAPVGSTAWATVTTPALQGNRTLLLRHGSAAYLLVFQNPAGGAGDAHPQFVISRDGGTTWAQREDPCGPTPRNSPDERDASDASVGADGALALLCSQRTSPGTGSVLTSTDQARTFGARQQVPAGSDALALAASSGSQIVVSALRGSLFELLLSEDGGATWRAVTSAAQGPGGRNGFLAFTTEQVGTALQPDRTHLWRTTDRGATWSSYVWGM